MTGPEHPASVEVVDPGSALGKAISIEVAEFIAEIDARIARDEAAARIREEGANS